MRKIKRLLHVLAINQNVKFRKCFVIERIFLNHFVIIVWVFVWKPMLNRLNTYICNESSRSSRKKTPWILELFNFFKYTKVKCKCKFEKIAQKHCNAWKKEKNGLTTRPNRFVTVFFLRLSYVSFICIVHSNYNHYLWIHCIAFLNNSPRRKVKHFTID